MLDTEQYARIYKNAYIPEHLPNYLEAFSDSRVHLHDEHLCLPRQDFLTFVGYPLTPGAQGTSEAYESACRRFAPETVAVIAPKIWLPVDSYESLGLDRYYRLQLPAGPPSAEVAYMVRRAERECAVKMGAYGREHGRLVKEFVTTHRLTRAQKAFYKRLPDYLKRSETARLLEARKGKSLAAFSVLDIGSAVYAFYLFNFRSLRTRVPGASDLLFREMIRLAESEGKKAINLGLGIHPGVCRFKEKWGGQPFISYASALVRRRSSVLGRLADKL